MGEALLAVFLTPTVVGAVAFFLLAKRKAIGALITGGICLVSVLPAFGLLAAMSSQRRLSDSDEQFGLVVFVIAAFILVSAVYVIARAAAQLELRTPHVGITVTGTVSGADEAAQSERKSDGNDS